MSAILLVGLIIAVLVLCSKLTETRYQLKQVRQERDVYQRIHDDALWDLYRSTMPKSYHEVPGTSDWYEQ
jgi:hypothetical protein